MDKYSWIGLTLMGLIVVGFMFLTRPSEEQLDAQRHYYDSIRVANQIADSLHAVSERQRQELADIEAQKQNVDTTAEHRDLLAQKLYANFAPAAFNQEQTIDVKTQKLHLTFSSKGARIEQARLLEYKAYGDTVNPLSLFRPDESSLDFTFIHRGNDYLHTSELNFLLADDSMLGDTVRQLTWRLQTDIDNSWLDFVYQIPADDYIVRFSIVPHNIQNVLLQNVTSAEMSWFQKIPQQERGRKFEDRYATLQYMFVNGDVKNLSESKAENKRLATPLRWIAYKDQFFSTVLISDESFESADVESSYPLDPITGKKDMRYIKQYNTRAVLGFMPEQNTQLNFRYYLGPNHYNTLKAYDKNVAKADRLNLKSLVPLGWKIVAWINMILVIPMFDLFTSWGLHIGIVILLMTLVIKLIILPFVFSSYRSSAKMRVLKPQIEEINQKYPPEKMQERQQATMALYQKAGVSPMSGCLPMLFQFPVLMAMFWFLPTAIELRGKSLFWADDLSAYDAIFTWTNNIPLIGNHISLFCLLMTLANIVYTYFNMQSQAGGGSEMKMMKWMMYLMPLMFFFIFNDYAAGLSYYYLVSLLITILQTMIFRWAIDDEKLLREMQAKQAKKSEKPKKSGFMARLEKMQREQQQYMREQAKKNARR